MIKGYVIWLRKIHNEPITKFLFEEGNYKLGPICRHFCILLMTLEEICSVCHWNSYCLSAMAHTITSG